MLNRLRRRLGRLHVRLLFVNAVVLLVPIVGLEFARVFERELLRSLERDMQNQATLVRRFLEANDTGLFDEGNERVLMQSAESTRTRIRVLDASAQTRLDSHKNGPPEGEEVPRFELSSRLSSSSDSGPLWTQLPERVEVKQALAGSRAAYTRVRQREPSVFLFLAEPLVIAGKVEGAVYVTRSTRPVMFELYRIREGLQRVLAVALLLTAAVTLWLAYSITRPLERLARVAVRISNGETELAIPISGSGELRDLGLALERMTERLRQRMRDTAAFAADVAHGFKSPLTSIRGAAELLAQGAADDPKARARFLANIELDSERLDRLVTRLLQLGRIEAASGVLQSIELKQLLEELANRSSTPDVAVQVQTEVRQAWVRARKEDLSAAFANLYDNAVRFSPRGAATLVQLVERKDHYAVSVIDQGTGVPAETEHRLFERFFTTDTEHGTGLGLAIVRSVAEAHGGRAYYRPSASSQQPGACFVVELPRPA